MKKETPGAAEETRSRTVCLAVSIIIAVFNAKKTLRCCSESVALPVLRRISVAIGDFEEAYFKALTSFFLKLGIDFFCGK